MSRSIKKPSYSDYSRNHTKWAKRQASKAVRKYQGEISNGKGYRKIYCSYNIFDYKGLWTGFIPDYCLANYLKSVRK